MGKNCGGTLGGPLEKAWAEDEPFDVWWYPKLVEGGMPNDDLELQLIWLKALEEVGPGVKAADLAHYWLDHIVYNFDEYGLSKTGLRLGLVPPLCSSYNNWFRDYMGCPIRSEIWACIAPGAPRIAVRYAYEDAIVDHAGGESVLGEFFNTAVESAAFLISDPRKLIEIGLSYLPEKCETRRMIQIAIDSHDAGKDWKETRRLLMEAAAPHRVAQYSPINLGIQILGWLYAKDFAETICLTANCGWDTDCTAATVGSYLGIILGGKGLPEKWTAPLGDALATSECNGGLAHTLTGPNPLPKDLNELTERTIAMARKVMAWHGNAFADPSDLSTFMADDSIRELWGFPATGFRASEGSVTVDVDYGVTPAVVEKSRKTFSMNVSNPHPRPMKVRLALGAPEGWETVEPQALEVPAFGSAPVAWSVAVPAARQIEVANRFVLDVRVDERPAQPATALVLPGARKFRHSQWHPAEGRDVRALLDAAFEEEQLQGSLTAPNARPGVWMEFNAFDNDLPLAPVVKGAGVLYVQGYVWSPVDREVFLCTPSTCAQKVWFNQEPVFETEEVKGLHPSYGDRSHRIAVKAGWNEMLLKLVNPQDAPTFEAHVTYCHMEFPCDPNWKQFLRGTVDLLWTRLPWD